MNTEENTTYQSSQQTSKIPTGKKCEFCGAELYDFKAIILGKERIFNISCKCIAIRRKKEDELEMKRRKKESLEKLFLQSRLGERFRNASFEMYKTTKDTKIIFDKVKNYTENFSDNKKNSILLFGPASTGKTFLASAVVNTLLKKGIPAIFLSVPDLLTQFMDTYNSSSTDREINLLKGTTDCDLLVLDEIALRKPKSKDDWSSEKLYQIINSRYANMKATIFTTNCTLSELSERLGSRTFSRIMEMSMNMSFDFTKAPDYRKINILNSLSKRYS
jgi:DNA replication protein DnaC